MKGKTSKINKPRLHLYKGKLVEKISDNYKDDTKRLRKRWKNKINREY